ncbi:hypothetical protein [uncultured Pseudokineococcus sp.]|uniref:hypothetical protein n=1 Tax=uncultured Pseudokineococcus sp. TaxID=1642928 RepID=UPI002628F5B3|nr:hypothetical protein [uncultured Pseudokineococcus sp.]
MDIQAARETKQELLRTAATALSAARTGDAGPGGLLVGVRVYGGGRYGLAVRHDGTAGAEVAARALELAGEDADVLDVGVVRALVGDGGPSTQRLDPQRLDPQRLDPGTPPADRSPVERDLAGAPTPARPGRWAAEVLQRRERPLRPGLSVAQRAVTAGTVGGFVARPGDPTRYLLSNNHVLADSDRAATGSAVLQPGSADGGTAADAVGRLSVAVPLQLASPNVVDAALAALDDDVEIDPTYPVGAVTTTTAADDGLLVEKVGRTTGLTRGAVTAIELDGVAVSYPSGVVTFDDQVEVTGADGAFSAGGDSGSLVYDPVTRAAVGLLFAGSERGGTGGAGLTFCNPVDAVLEALGVHLLAP